MVTGEDMAEKLMNNSSLRDRPGVQKSKGESGVKEIQTHPVTFIIFILEVSGYSSPIPWAKLLIKGHNGAPLVQSAFC